MRPLRFLAALILAAGGAAAQVYSPKVLLEGQPDPTDLQALAQGIYRQAGAHTPRERAEAIWRFFLTDGRFVKPGFWYHIAGWAYEEPSGEVLDPVKLLNSYGFGLCYHIAPLLEAVWKAGGFADARVWFLTGHTVAEVYYDGGYHYYDSDMMGYNTAGRGPARESPVASVHQIELDGNLILSKLKNPTTVDAAVVDAPWYPADVREAAIGGLAELFTTTGDNWLFPYERAPQGHRMDFELHRGQRLVRYFQPEQGNLSYLPYKFTGRAWEEFPQEVAQYQIRTDDGPHSQKDARRWATGVLEDRLDDLAAGRVVEMHSPYVIIDAQFQVEAALSAGSRVALETSRDGGRNWDLAGTLSGPRQGIWQTGPAVLTRSAHGSRNAAGGAYDYLVRVNLDGQATLRHALLRTRFQLNPRTLPELAPGHNELIYTSGQAIMRRELAGEPEQSVNARYVSDGGQGYWIPQAGGAGDLLFRIAGQDGAPLTGFDAGGRFLDLSGGLAPDKFTAEVRRVTPLPARQPAASIAWSRSPDGPFETIWEFDPRLSWKDGVPIDRVLRWPEVDRHVAVPNLSAVYVRYRIRDLGLDSFRLAVESPGGAAPQPLAVTHAWKENGIARTYTQLVPAGTRELRYAIEIPAGARVENQALVFEAR